MGPWVELGKRKRVRDRVKISPVARTKAKPGKATVGQGARSGWTYYCLHQKLGVVLCLQWSVEMVWTA